MAKKKGLYVGTQDRFPTAAERRRLADLCEHEGLHKACADCSKTIEQVIEIVGPMMKDRIFTAKMLTERFL